MNRFAAKFWSLAIFLIIVNSAGIVWIHHDLTRIPPRATRIATVFPLVNAERTDRVTLVFDRAVMDSSLAAARPVGDLFQFEPDWPGQWEWINADTLTYRFDKPLPPGRIFTVRPAVDFQAATGWTLDGRDRFEIKTTPLEMAFCRLESADPHQITLELGFNQPVAPADLVRAVQFTDTQTGQILDQVHCLTQKTATQQVLQVNRPSSNQLTMTLGAGLKGDQAQLPMEQAVSREFKLQPGFALLSCHASTAGLSEGATVTLRFTQPLNRDQKLPQPRIEPAVDPLTIHSESRYLHLNGGFRPGETYTIAIPATLTDANDKTLGGEQIATVRIPDYYPAVSFSHSQGILTPRGNLQVDLRSVNVDQVEFKIWKLHNNNLVAHLHHNWIERTSREILTRTVALKQSHNQPGDLILNLGEWLGQPRGVYRIEAQPANQPWESSTALVTITDLALTAKTERSGMLVWVTSLLTGQPLADVTVSGLSYNNQILATARTDTRGLARLTYAATHPDGLPWVITAALGDDLACLQPGDNQWLLDDVNQAGRDYPGHYEVMLYPERGVYRPGDTIHLTGILRAGHGGVPDPFALTVRVRRPDGRQVAEIPVEPANNGQGIFHGQFVTTPADQTGVYQFSVTLPGSEEALGSVSAQVEAFVPVRMEVTSHPVQERFGPGQAPRVQISARYLWDQPAGDLAARLEGTLRAENYSSKAYPDYRFGVPVPGQPIPLEAATGQLDPEGKTQLPAGLPGDLKPGRYRTWLSATVTETGGRSVSSNTQCIVDQLGLHLGLRLPAGNLAECQKPVTVEWLALTGDDTPAPPGDLRMVLGRVEYDTVLKEVNGRYVWRSEELFHEMTSRTLAAGADSGSFEISCPAAGPYRVVLTDPATQSESRLEFYAGAAGDTWSGLSMNQPERLELVTGRTRYAPGEPMDILVRSPIPGTLLLTLETDRVVAWHIQAISESTAALQMTIPAELRGGVYLAATVVRPVDPEAKSWLPHRAMGMLRLELDHGDRRLPIVMEAPSHSPPGAGLAVSIQAPPPSDPNRPACVHLWAVDDGILLTSGFQTPDPFAFFLSPRRPGVATADVFYRLLPDFDRPPGLARIGADGDMALDYDPLRRNPVAAKTRLPAVVWREVLAVGPDGKAAVTLPLPDLTGRLRLMAVAVDQDRYGRASQEVVLTRPLIVEASWPRFAAPGDRFDIPVKLFNTTGQPLTLTVATHIDGPLEIDAGSLPAQITVSPDQPATVWLSARATGVGPVDARIEAAGSDPDGRPFSAHSQGLLPVRPANPLHSEVTIQAGPAGETLSLSPPGTLAAGSVRTTLRLSARPDVRMAAALEALIDYPYGCAEQTASRLLALLYAPSVLDPGRGEAVGEMIAAGIHRLWSMQTLSGGLSYWPGHPQPDEWATAYGAGCLAEIRQAGYAVDPQLIDGLVRYLQNRLADVRTGEQPDWNTVALLCRVLAAFDQPPLGWMNRLAERPSDLDLGGRADLAGAFVAAGRKDRALAVLPAGLPESGSIASTHSGRITSQTRQLALWLSTLLDIDPNHPHAALLAGQLWHSQSRGRWDNTLENGSAVMALARYQLLAPAQAPEFRGTVRTPGGLTVPFDHQTGLVRQFQPADLPLVVATEGTGQVYAWVSYEGLAAPGTVQPHQRRIAVERRWTDRAGKAVAPDGIRVGDLIYVHVDVQASEDRIDHVAVVDALPAGLEVENPRLILSADTGKAEGAPTADHVEFLDDRVLLFCPATREKQTFQYCLRAITAGRFDLPPLQASCMYDPSAAALGPGGSITVLK